MRCNVEKLKCGLVREEVLNDSLIKRSPREVHLRNFRYTNEGLDLASCLIINDIFLGRNIVSLTRNSLRKYSRKKAMCEEILVTCHREAFKNRLMVG